MSRLVAFVPEEKPTWYTTRTSLCEIIFTLELIEMVLAKSEPDITAHYDQSLVSALL
jgi:hypothetical protein